MLKKEQICTRCVMDTSAEGITFNNDGVCNYCLDFEKELINTKKDVKDIDKLINEIKINGKGKKYDCVVGVSGGADSSYSLYLATKYNLRVLAVHMDNGWNSELATNNIKNIVEKFNINLYTHVIEWNEYRDLMQAFFDVDVIDVELLYDNAMLAVNYALANKYDIKYILSGSNTSTEGMKMPLNWNWRKLDKKNIKSIGNRNGVKLKTFPTIGRLNLSYYNKIKKIKWVHFLDYIDYNKAECMDFLKKEFGFKPYPYKHYESIFTRFYQAYILPNKFGVDKRKLHLSSLIISKQMSRENALLELNKNPYPNKEDLKDDIEYFLKKMNWEKNDLENYISRSERKHLEFGSEIPMWNKISKLLKKIR